MKHTPIQLTPAQARRIWLHAQRLDTSEPFGSGPAATPAAVAHLGYVQIDTIHVIERSHHHILQTRIPTYRREHLHQAQSIDKTVFESWAHALAYLPSETLRFHVRAMRKDWGRRTGWFGKWTENDIRRVLARIKREGPISVRDVDTDIKGRKDFTWGTNKPTKRALEVAFFRGLVAISGRTGMVKSYELLTRHFGINRLPRAATDRETMNYLLDRALTSQGVVSLESICHLDAPRKPAMKRLLDARVRRGELVPVEFGKSAHWARPETLETIPEPADELVHILNPFDPLIIQRKRLRQFFEYEHRFEAYVPKDKRVFGYFVCPVLVGDRIVAGLDLKTDRQQQKLLMQRWNWVGRRSSKRLIEEALHRFEQFQLAR